MEKAIRNDKADRSAVQMNLGRRRPHGRLDFEAATHLASSKLALKSEALYGNDQVGPPCGTAYVWQISRHPFHLHNTKWALVAWDWRSLSIVLYFHL
jgi:hypothetical protein